MHAAPAQRQEEEHGGERHQHRPQHVEAVRPLMAGKLAERAPGHPQGHGTQRQVDPEDHRPVQVLGEEAAQHRPGDARQHEHAGEIALVAGPLLGRHDVGDDGLRQRDQPAAAQPLQRTGADQRQHRGGESAGGRAQDEDADADQQDLAPAVDVAELAVERCHRGGAEEIGRHHPGQVRQVAELAPDGGQGGGDDGLVEGGQEHGEHDADDDRADGGMLEDRRRVGDGRGDRHHQSWRRTARA